MKVEFLNWYESLPYDYYVIVSNGKPKFFFTLDSFEDGVNRAQLPAQVFRIRCQENIGSTYLHGLFENPDWFFTGSWTVNNDGFVEYDECETFNILTTIGIPWSAMYSYQNGKKVQSREITADLTLEAKIVRSVDA